MKHIILIGVAMLAAACVGRSSQAPSPVAPSAITAPGSAPRPAPVPRPDSPAVCWTMPPFGGDDAWPPTGGCFASGRPYADIAALIAAYPQGTWGVSGQGCAWAEVLPDGTWHIAVSHRCPS